MNAGARVRLLGLGFAGGSIGAASASLLDALDEHQPVVATLHPSLAPAFDLLVKLRHMNPDRGVWRARAGFNDATFNALTAGVERELRRHEGEFDVIVQSQTLFAPGELAAKRPFVIYTDNIIALTERFYPRWASLDAAEFRHWRELEAQICRAAAFVLPWSGFVRDALISDYGCEPDRVLSVGAGANIVLGSLQSRRWDSRTAMFVGTNFTIKGGEVLLRAWPLVRERLPEARLIVVGPERPPPGADLDGVEWRGHVAGRDELTRLYERASVFVMPSLFEAWGHVFLEAMGCGLGCIGTTRCAMPEIIADGRTGRLVPPGEVEPLADALATVLEDPAQAESWGRHAHQSVIAGRRWSDVAERVAPALIAARELPAVPAEAGTPRSERWLRRWGRAGRATWRPRTWARERAI